jgi:hypothetical protein
VVSIEKKKRVQLHLENARKHAVTACRFADTQMAAREIKDAVADLSQAIELLTESLDQRREFY